MSTDHSEPRRLIAIVGPTATGKTSLALRLAEELDGEVINADSRQVYRGMDVGTAKPPVTDRRRVRHWLVDVADPDTPFSLVHYLDLAKEAIESCWSRGSQPILVGGTGQYVWAVVEGWQIPRVPPNKKLRSELEALLEQAGIGGLAAELARIDPVSARNIDAANPRRIIRAIEVFCATGRSLSEARAIEPPSFRTTVIGLDCPRDDLYGRIDARVDAMMDAGFLEEVRSLIARGYRCDLPSMSSIGYLQLCQHLSGELSLDEAIVRTKTETHRLARMQINWFRRRDERIHWIDVSMGDPFEAASGVVESSKRDKR